MAKIEMDLSEYQEIQKVNRLLEESLDKERVMADEIAKLKQEKIDILKDNEKSVTIIEQIDSVDTIKTLLPHDTILENLYRLFHQGKSLPYNSYSVSAYDDMGQPIINRFAEAFFKTETLKMYSQEKSVIRKGFSEVKEEARQEFLKGLRDDYKGKLSSLESEVKKLRDENRGIDGLKKINKQLDSDYKRTINNYTFYRSVSHNYERGLNQVKSVLEGKATIFNSRSKVGSLLNLIRETDKEFENLKKTRK